ncbi:MAG: hypothetical protein HYR87_06880 [Thaumarchaeota archaeon]|nr:hypothetical protein [Nitrososphaerota archaeon]
MGIIVFPIIAYGQTPAELGYRFLPNKIVANTDVVLQIYAKGDSVPQSISNLIATSSDSSIIQILDVEKTPNDFNTYVKIKALNPGTATIALAAPGFASQEVPVTVYDDYNAPTKLLIKATPTTFSTIGSEKGYVAVELVNDAGIPLQARQDTSITLSTSDSNIVNLQNTELTIKTGDYYAIEEFDVKKDGTAKISASAQSMAAVSSTVTVSTTVTQKTIQLYVFPKILNIHQNSFGYVIAELQQSGIPVQATEDITIPIQVTNATGLHMINTSLENPPVTANAPIIIKKGSYYGYTQISVAAGTPGWIVSPIGMEGQWNVGFNVKGYLTSPVVTISTTNGPLLNDHTAALDLIPVLATGQKELIGALHLEDDSFNVPGPPVIANKDLQIEVDSSAPNTLSVDKVNISRGTGIGLVFAKVSSTIPVQPTLNVVTIAPQTVSQTYAPTITVPTSNSMVLVADPLLPALLTNNDFPLALYMTKSGTIDYFTEDMTPFISPKDVLQTESKTLTKGESIVLLNSRSLKSDPSTVSISAGDFVTNILMKSFSSKPASISIDYPDTILSNFKNTFSIQLLDSQNNPVFLQDDTQFKLIASDPTILNAPDSVVIKKGSYYSLFDVKASNTGKSELAVLSSDLPLAKFDIDVTSLTPNIIIVSTDHVDPNITFDSTLTAQYQNAPLSGLKVDWGVKGAKIQSMDSVTDKDGKAKISLISQDPNTITIQASVSGGIFGTTTVSKDIAVNPPLIQGSSTANTNTNSFSIMGINPLFIIIPSAAAAGGIILKKKNMLDGMSEKMNLGEKFLEIKERISAMREK